VDKSRLTSTPRRSRTYSSLAIRLDGVQAMTNGLYRPVAYNHVPDAFLREEIFRRADWLLSDAYGMFAMQPVSGPGGGNWTIALVLLCVVDGISCHIYPTDAVARRQEQRFKRLINDKLHWGPATKGWYNKQNAAAVLYTEFRNPLVHELAIDKPARARPSTFHESAIGKWGPVQNKDIEMIDAMTTWNDDWPTLSVEDYNGGKRLKLSCAALYWAVKKMVNALAADSSILNAAVAFHNKPKPQKGP
jgi:hypothetical protein